MPDWARIRREPWARTFIVGLSGRADEEETRASIPAMAAESLRISRMSFPFPVSGWYFPAELDPTWTEAPRLIPPALERLPRPLWISAYDRSNMGADEFAQWLDSFVPKDVGVLFQDGVGVWARTPAVAREYADALRRTLGRDRVRIIAEAFREQEDGSFRRAEASELRPQLQAYRGYQLYLFDGPHYVPDAVIGELLRR